VILWLPCPRNHHEWVTWQERPEADRRNPEIDVLPSFDVKWLLKLYAEPDRTIYVRDVGSRTAIPEEAILDMMVALQNAANILKTSIGNPVQPSFLGSRLLNVALLYNIRYEGSSSTVTFSD
jgi:hypothetical protein